MGMDILEQNELKITRRRLCHTEGDLRAVVQEPVGESVGIAILKDSASTLHCEAERLIRIAESWASRAEPETDA